MSNHVFETRPGGGGIMFRRTVTAEQGIAFSTRTKTVSTYLHITDTFSPRTPVRARMYVRGLWIGWTNAFYVRPLGPLTTRYRSS